MIQGTIEELQIIIEEGKGLVQKRPTDVCGLEMLDKGLPDEGECQRWFVKARTWIGRVYGRQSLEYQEFLEMKQTHAWRNLLGSRFGETSFLRRDMMLMVAHLEGLGETLGLGTITDGTSYRQLAVLEKTLRGLISKELSRLSDDWWKTGAPDDVKLRAEERMVKSEPRWPWAPGGSDDPLDYIDFADYIKIITRKDNWKQWFSSVFGDRDIITAKLRELEPIRNSLVHSRPLRPRDFERLKLAVEDIVDSVNQANP